MLWLVVAGERAGRVTAPTELPSTSIVRHVVAGVRRDGERLVRAGIHRRRSQTAMPPDPAAALMVKVEGGQPAVPP